MSTIGSGRLWKIDAAGASIIVALVATAYVVQVRPAISRREQAKAQSTQLSAERARQAELERSLRALRERATRMELAAADPELELAPPERLNQYLAALTALAGDSGLEVDSLVSGTTIQQPRFWAVPIRISGRGSYRSCEAMLRRLRATMGDMELVSMQLTAPPATVDSARNPGTAATFVFELRWYTFPESRRAGK